MPQEIDRELRRDVDEHDRYVEEHAEVLKQNPALLREVMVKGNDLADTVTRPKQLAEVTKSFAVTTSSTVAYVASVDADTQGLTPMTFILRLRERFRLEEELEERLPDSQHFPEGAFDWEGLGEEASTRFPTAPCAGCLLGSWRCPPRVRRAAQRRAAADPEAPEVRPQDRRADVMEKEESEIEGVKNDMYEALARLEGEQVPMINLVLNHFSFAQTVENLFALSFLVTQSAVRIGEDEEQGYVVHFLGRRKKVRRGEAAPREAEPLQFVLEMDMAVWKDMRQVCDQGECLMRHRTPRLHPGEERYLQLSQAALAEFDPDLAEDLTQPPPPPRAATPEARASSSAGGEGSSRQAAPQGGRRAPKRRKG